MVDLTASITNVGSAEVNDPYKVAVYDGAPEAGDAGIIYDGILNLSTEAPQVSLEQRLSSGAWDTLGARLGEHPLFLVIDSPEHRAVAGRPGQTPSRTPLPGFQLAVDDGLVVGGAPGVAEGRDWSIEVYATDEATTDPERLIGRWSALDGFVNQTQETTTTWQTWRTTQSQPILLVIQSEDGLPLPAFETPFDLTLTLWVDDENTSTPAEIATVAVKLPVQ